MISERGSDGMIKHGSLSSGLHSLDEILSGGFNRGSLVGLHGSGIHLATQLSIVAQLPESNGGLGSQVLWFEYEKFPADVLRNVAHRFGLNADKAINSIEISKAQLDSSEGLSHAVEEGVQFIVVEDLYKLGKQTEEQREGLALLKDWVSRVNGVCVIVNPLRPLMHDAVSCWRALSPKSSDYTLTLVSEVAIADIDRRPAACEKLVGISLHKGSKAPLVWAEACLVDGGLIDCKNHNVDVNA